jgi:hypothetical protein
MIEYSPFQYLITTSPRLQWITVEGAAKGDPILVGVSRKAQRQC